ncbi:MAG TPA: SDR family NAD(P)-dependent oxidoreductase, partial [Chloroflexota bacterium]
MSEQQGGGTRPTQQPGRESQMTPRPRVERPEYRGCGKLADKVAIVTGGDSGIGRAVAVAFAKEGADVAIVYLNEGDDAQETKRLVEAEGHRCLTIAGDVGDEQLAQQAVERTVGELGRLDVLVNNAAEQHVASSIEEINQEQLERTFRTNIFGYFFMTKAAMKHLREG